MDWSPATWWWLAAGVLVAAELATGTFYLLLLALGCTVAALAGHAGVSTTMQVATAALVGGGATAAWHFKRARRPRSAPAQRNADMLLDIGQRVQVLRWDHDTHTQVQYRGANWTAHFEGPGTPQPGEHVIVSMQGSELRLAPAPER